MSLGRALGRGETLSAALAGKLSVTEGVYTAAAVCRMAAEKGIDMPICGAVHAVIEGRASVADAIGQLMQRPLKAED
jgi:glycerol-3-phosphate dehydrogenase (NAD(P)+)